MKNWATILITVVITSVFWLLIGLGAFLYVMYVVEGDPPFHVSLDYPHEVRLGVPFDLNVSVTNLADKRRTIGSVYIDDSLLKGFEILSVSPKPDSEENVADVHASSYARAIEPSETISFQFRLRGKEEGSFWGDVDTFTPGLRYTTVSAAIKVEAEQVD